MGGNELSGDLKNSRVENSVFTARTFFDVSACALARTEAQSVFNYVQQSRRGGWGLLYFIVCHSGVIKRASWRQNVDSNRQLS